MPVVKELLVEQLQDLLHAETQLTKAIPNMVEAGLIAEGEEVIEEGEEKEPLAADLALIAAAQRVEHYEISAYGTARTLARQLGLPEAARLLAHTLGEEESADFLLTAISDPLLQQATLDDLGGKVNLESVPSDRAKAPARSGSRSSRKEKGAA